MSVTASGIAGAAARGAGAPDAWGRALIGAAAVLAAALTVAPAARAQDQGAAEAEMSAEDANPAEAQTPAEAAAESPAATESGVDDAVAFAEALTSAATAALADPDAGADARLAAFEEVLRKGLALDAIGRFMIGETRDAMSEAQIARYEAAFPAYITRQYARQFEAIVGRPLEVVAARALTERDAIVRTRFERENESPVNVDWRVRNYPDVGRKAIDIVVSGVSIMLVKRQEFSAFVAQNGVDALLDQIEAEAKET